MKDAFSVTAGFLALFSFVFYIRAIWVTRKLPPGSPNKAEPSKVSWIIWASLDTMIFFQMFSGGAINGQILAIAICSWGVVALVIKFGSSKWDLVDKICLGGLAFGAVAWAFVDPVTGIIVCLATNIVGTIPTCISAWKNPKHESLLAWVISCSACVFATVAIPEVTMQHAAQPIVFLAINVAVIFILVFRRKYLGWVI